MSLRYRVPGTLVTVFLIIACAIGVGYVLASGTFRSQHAATQLAVRVTAVPVSSISKPIRLAKAGAIGRAATTPVTADFAGQISEVYVAEGQQVKAGQPICKLEPSSPAYVADDAPAATPALSSAGQGDYEDALKEYSRLQKLYDIGAIPRKQLEAAAARLQTAKESMAGGQTSAVVSGAGRAVVTGPITVTAQVDGQVSGLAVASGKAVQAGQQLMTLGSGQDVELVIPLTADELYLVQLGTPVILETGDRQVTGQVISIYPEVKDNQAILFVAHCKVTDNPGGILQPGLAVNAHIDTGSTTTVQAVPTTAIFQDEQGQSFIYTAAGSAAVPQQITTGENIGDYTELLSALPQDTKVITDHINDIRNGAAIAVEP